MALLEVIVAMTIFVVAGLSVVTWVCEVTDTVVRVHETTTHFRNASDYLDVVALWPREDLDRHLGSRQAGPWIVRIDRPTPVLYVISIADSANAPPLLSTALYRRKEADATQ